MKRANLRVVLPGVFIGLLTLATDARPALAQGLPVPVQLPNLGDLLNDSTGWFGKLFHDALVAVAQEALTAAITFMATLLGQDSLITRTPALLSYANPAVRNLSGDTVTLANIALGAVTAWGGVNLIIGPHIRVPYYGALELVPRVLLSAFMINTSLNWCQFVIDMNNALCTAIGGGIIPGWASAQEQVPDGPALLLNLIAVAVYVVMSLLLVAQMLMRLALVDVMLVVAPLALLCWVLPQTYSWAQLWFNTFFGTVFVQAVQVLVLRLGTDMTQNLPSLLSDIGSNPLDKAHAWLMSLLLGMAVLQLTRNIPRLMPGYPGGMGSAPSELAAAQRVRQFFTPGSNRQASTTSAKKTAT